MSRLLVGFFDDGFDGFRGFERPDDQRLYERKLKPSVSNNVAAVFVDVSYSLLWGHVVKAATPVQGIPALPCSRPLICVGMDRFLQSARIVSLPLHRFSC